MYPGTSRDADSSQRECYLFGDFELDMSALELRQDGQVLAITSKSLSILGHLVRHRERIVSRDELIATAWPDVRIATGSLTQAVWEIRSRLREGSLSSPSIRTVHGRGYQFVAPVRPRECLSPALELRIRSLQTNELQAVIELALLLVSSRAASRPSIRPRLPA